MTKRTASDTRSVAALGVTVLKAGAFLDAVYAAQPAQAEQAVLNAIRDLTDPPYTRGELLAALETHGTRTLVDALAKKWKVVPMEKRARSALGPFHG
jgi:hypothetical protein